jgi:hypothetical protein
VALLAKQSGDPGIAPTAMESTVDENEDCHGRRGGQIFRTWPPSTHQVWPVTQLD